MAAGGAFGGARGAGARPPERGVFPLDHGGECAPVAREYLACLRGAGGDAGGACREVSRRYLECRMSRGLMAQEDLRRLGFRADGGAGAADGGAEAAEGEGRRRAREGFVAGEAWADAGSAPPPRGGDRNEGGHASQSG